MITNLYFVRHAHSNYSTDELGRPLSEQGLVDAKKITDLLKRENIDVVVSSPYKRAFQTVEGIANHLKSEIEIIDAFKERILSEQPVADFKEAMLQVWSDFDISLPGGESNHNAQTRGVRATKKILGKYEGQNVVIGTHGNIMVLIMNYFDPIYDFGFWKQLEMPDIYQLTFYEQQLITVKRVDKESSKNSTGFTIFKRSEIQTNFQKVDLELKRMIGTITLHDKVILTIEVDLLNDFMKVNGEAKQLEQIMSERGLDMEYIEMLKEMTRFFVENQITEPQKYYEKLSK
ncbi:histidine phosphatase family protein [Psychrobacillus sp. INOP01]|uniref:histidine phosphatase family protein n=1 Tax=Psychrobacillus sp. INOP01 TaxID=2829187 RepID=UPI001BAA422D|nr:histidine phosphatase family protein [Psychrobacillus sp. INOP01]